VGLQRIYRVNALDLAKPFQNAIICVPSVLELESTNFTGMLINI
jgi:hypothetical protein